MSVRVNNISKFTKLIIIVEFSLVAYLLYSLTKNVYNGYQVDKYIEAFEEENGNLELENQQKMDDFLYYTSDEYIDKIAKQNLGRVNPGEHVIVLSESRLQEDKALDELEDESFAKYTELSNPAQWWDFFFGV